MNSDTIKRWLDEPIVYTRADVARLLASGALAGAALALALFVR